MVSVNSEWQVQALLDLKANLSKTDVRSIKKTLTENRDAPNIGNPTAFFSKVLKKKKSLLNVTAGKPALI